MSDFAKVFHSEEYGQLVVMLDRNDRGDPALMVFFNHPHPDLGVCSIAPSWDDTDEGWDRAEKAFSDSNLELAEALVRRHV